MLLTQRSQTFQAALVFPEGSNRASNVQNTGNGTVWLGRAVRQSTQTRKGREEIAFSITELTCTEIPISALMHNIFRMVNIQLLLIIMHHSRIDVLAKDVDVCRREFSGADFLFEEYVKFGKRTSHGFREAEIDVDYAEEADSGLFSM